MKKNLYFRFFIALGTLFLLLIFVKTISVSHIKAQGSDQQLAFLSGLDDVSVLESKKASGDGLQSYLPIVNNTDCVIGYFDDFKDPTSGWPIVNDDFVQLAYQDWVIYPLRLDWQGYGGVSIDTDKSGQIHISYHDVDNQQLIYAFQDNYGWSEEVVATTDGGYFVSLKTDPLGYPHIAYTSYTNLNPGNLNLIHAYKNSTGWHSETVDTEHSTSLSLDIDINGYGHIAFFDNFNLKYAYQDSLGWHVEFVDNSGANGEFPSLALDDLGYPHISYYSATSGSLKYAHQDSEGWHIEIVDQGTPEILIFSGYSTALALDANNSPHIAYVVYNDDPMHSVLMYAYFADDTWKKELIYNDADNTGIIATSLVLDHDNIPHISFGHAINLYYASKETGNWQTETIDSGALETQLAFDPKGDIHLCYKDQFFNALKYANKNGEYKILVKSPGTVIIQSGFQANNYRLSVDVRNVADRPGSYGLVFGMADNISELYTFEIFPDSRYEIWKYNSSALPEWNLLAQGTSSAILPGIANNHLQVVRDNDLIEVYANNELLTSLYDASYLGLRQVGLIVNGGEINFDIRFDKFSVCTKDSSISNQSQNQLINTDEIDWITLQR